PDMFAHPAQVAETLSSLVGEGKIRAVGVSNHRPAQHDALIAHLGDLPLATSQPEYSPAFLGPLRDGTFDLCMRDGIVPLAWSPLGGGRLMSGENVPAALIATLDEIAEREGVDRAAICYAFVLAHPSAPVALLGTQNPDRLRAAVAALDVTLDRNDVYRIVQDSEGVPLP
ncbi:MAG: aldo/keto reductase, partial [Acidimicrobiales bacterium]